MEGRSMVFPLMSPYTIGFDCEFKWAELNDYCAFCCLNVF